MPGIEVLDDGKILYQGKPINKYYIEGLDLLEGKYNLANSNLPHKEVVKVQLDPFLETADVDLNNNYWPAKNEPTRFQMYKSNYKKKKENPMQRAIRAEEMENK